MLAARGQLSIAIADTFYDARAMPRTFRRATPARCLRRAYGHATSYFSTQKLRDFDCCLMRRHRIERAVI